MPFLEDQTEKSLKPDIPAPSSAQLLRGDGDKVERRVLVIMLCKQDPDTGVTRWSSKYLLRAL